MAVSGCDSSPDFSCRVRCAQWISAVGGAFLAATSKLSTPLRNEMNDDFRYLLLSEVVVRERLVSPEQPVSPIKIESAPPPLFYPFPHPPLTGGWICREIVASASPHVPCGVPPRSLLCGSLTADSGGAGAEIKEAWRWWSFSSTVAKLAMAQAAAHVAQSFSPTKNTAVTCTAAVLNVLVSGAMWYRCASLPALMPPAAVPPPCCCADRGGP